MSLSPVMVELRAGISQFTAKMAEARAEVTKLQTAGAANMAKFQSVGKGALLGVAAATVAVGVASLRSAAEFETLTTQLVTGAGVSKDRIGEVRQGLLKMSTQTGTSANDLAKAFYLVSSAGYSGSRAMEVMRAAAEGAKTGQADLTTTTDALTTVMNAYRSSNLSAVGTMDQMVAVEKAGKLHMEDLAGSLGTVVPIAARAHLSFAEVGGAMATMSAQGVNAHNAATYLRMSIGNLEAPSKKAANEMAALGINSTDLSAHLGERGLTGTLSIIQDALKAKFGNAATAMIESLRAASGETGKFNKKLNELPPAQQTVVGALATMMGGVKSMQAGLLLTGDQLGKFKQNVNSVADSAKHAGKDVEGWDLIQRTFNQHMDRLKATVNAAFIEIGMHLIPIVVSAMDLIAKHKTTVEVMAVAIGTFLVAAIAAYVASLAVAAAKSIVDFAKMTAAALKWVAEQVAAMVRLGVSIGVLIAEYAAMAAKSALNFLKMSAAAVASSATQVIAWGSAAAAATAAFIAENLATLGIAAAIALLIAAVVYAATHWRQIWDTIKSVAGAAKDFIVSHIDLISPAFHPVVAVLTGFASVWRSIWNAIAGVIRAVGAEISAIVGGIGSAVSSVANAISTVSSIASGVGSAVKSVIPGFAGGVKNYSGGLALVGEKGPELVNLPRGSSVHTAAETGQMLGNDNSRVEELLGMLLDKVDRMPMQMTAMRRAG